MMDIEWSAGITEIDLNTEKRFCCLRMQIILENLPEGVILGTVARPVCYQTANE